MEYTAIVPARSGSKRLPNKNITELAGKPLVVWTLEACINSEKIDKVILSTDSMEYWDIVNKHVNSAKLVLDFRSKEDADDNVKIFDYLKNNRAEVFEDRKGAFILALPTVPLRNTSHIDECIALFESSRNSVFSASEYEFPISFAFTENGSNSWVPLFKDSPMLTGNTRSQNQKTSFHPNGAVYVRLIEDLSDSNLSTLYSEAVPYIMSRLDSIDIDTHSDFAYAKFILEQKLSY